MVDRPRPLPFAVAVTYAISVHETGHILATKYRGLKTSGIWFIRFLGAVAVARQPFRSHGETYFVAIAGPIFGLFSPRLGFAVVGGGLLLCAGLLALSGSELLALLLLLSIFELLRSRRTDLLPPMSWKAVAGGPALYILLFVLFPALGLIEASASKYLLTPRVAMVAAELDPALSKLADAGCAREGTHIRSPEPNRPRSRSQTTVW